MLLEEITVGEVIAKTSRLFIVSSFFLSAILSFMWAEISLINGAWMISTAIVLGQLGMFIIAGYFIYQMIIMDQSTMFTRKSKEEEPNVNKKEPGNLERFFKDLIQVSNTILDTRISGILGKCMEGLLLFLLSGVYTSLLSAPGTSGIGICFAISSSITPIGFLLVCVSFIHECREYKKHFKKKDNIHEKEGFREPEEDKKPEEPEEFRELTKTEAEKVGNEELLCK